MPLKYILASLFVVGLFSLFGQPRGDADLLARIRVKVRENLAQLPDYTCIETIERSVRYTPAGKFTISDNIRLEVAYVDGKELFGWPGTAKIEEPDITKFVQGAIGNGDFAFLPKNIFFTESAKFHLEGETDLEGKRSIRFEYSVPRDTGLFSIRTASGRDFAGSRGAFWVDAGTLDLIRIESAAFDIPAILGLASTTTILNYGRSMIGSSMFLLPQTSELDLALVDGTENRNRMTFHGCRQFSGVSVLKFGKPAAEPAVGPVVDAAVEPTARPAAVAPGRVLKTVNLPGEFEVEIKLVTAIDSLTAATGDLVRATLGQNVKVGRDIVVPKGAEVTCRIAVLEKRSGYYVMDLQAIFIDFEDGHADLLGRENRIGMMIARSGRTNAASLFSSSRQFFPTNHLQIPRGAGFILRSRLLKSKDNDSIRP